MGRPGFIFGAPFLLGSFWIQLIGRRVAGGYWSDEIYQSHDLNLLDAADLKTVWSGSAVTSGQVGFADSQDFYNSLANAAIKKLYKEGLIPAN